MSSGIAGRFNAVLAVCGVLFALTVHAAPVATVTHLAGVLAIKDNSETPRLLSVGSTVEAGTVLSTTQKTYARLKFTDGSEITLKPETLFKVEAFYYDEKEPQKDSAVFNLVKGGLRTITGLVGKRKQDSYSMNTPVATIGIRGTRFDLHLCFPGRCGSAPNGLHANVVEGRIRMFNASGVPLEVGQGQSAHVSAIGVAPVLLLAQPAGLPEYKPPPSVLPPPAMNDPTVGNQDTRRTDCQVR